MPKVGVELLRRKEEKVQKEETRDTMNSLTGVPFGAWRTPWVDPRLIPLDIAACDRGSLHSSSHSGMESYKGGIGGVLRVLVVLLPPRNTGGIFITTLPPFMVVTHHSLLCGYRCLVTMLVI